MPGQAQKTKGNPASKRMSNVNLQARRERSFARGQKRKGARQKLQEARAKHNRDLRSQGQPTAWQVACAGRRAQRDHARAEGSLASSVGGRS